jgi:hypothetical protein
MGTNFAGGLLRTRLRNKWNAPQRSIGCGNGEGKQNSGFGGINPPAALRWREGEASLTMLGFGLLVLLFVRVIVLLTLVGIILLVLLILLTLLRVMLRILFGILVWFVIHEENSFTSLDVCKR